MLYVDHADTVNDIRMQKILEDNILLTCFLHHWNFPPNLTRKTRLPAAAPTSAVAVRSFTGKLRCFPLPSPPTPTEEKLFSTRIQRR